VLVLIRWSISFVTHGRGARLITARVADEVEDNRPYFRS
jgi:hypothetical protein